MLTDEKRWLICWKLMGKPQTLGAKMFASIPEVVLAPSCTFLCVDGGPALYVHQFGTRYQLFELDGRFLCFDEYTPLMAHVRNRLSAWLADR